ncbi:hypothetical protein Q5741_19700 [Paenibacillus sp. JX-17]|uniref:Uncharacterized protein n=1 Tax=Paenibacillus lacisoli TaxID=3064525 RepID=A0ABT9CH66_9BACL|nr:hypothetical protein [Paenibacillus sp. JX-17]MDO7908616.1 hypothetical protein [Paenibacillus sp. JX-17]
MKIQTLSRSAALPYRRAAANQKTASLPTMPPIIKELIRFEDELEMERHSLGFDLGLVMERGSGTRYMPTPPDVIPFAHAGRDGIHYGFLTDFGMTRSLEEAPIVAVAPMSVNSVWLVARSIREFLNVLYSCPELLTRFDGTAESYQLHAITEGDPRQERVRERFRERFNITPVTDPCEYMTRLMEDRRRQVAVPTLNGLGVRSLSDTRDICHTCYTVPEQIDWQLNGPAVQLFFASATPEAKLAFVRDIQSNHLLTDDGLRTFVDGELRTFGFAEVADRLNESYYIPYIEA